MGTALGRVRHSVKYGNPFFLLSPMSWISLILSGTPAEAHLIQSIAQALLYYISPLLFALLYFVLPSPYGKLATPSWNQRLGPALPACWAWFLFELPNLLWAVVTAWKHGQAQQRSLSVPLLEGASSSPSPSSLPVCSYILFGFFVVHYIRRALLYPLQLSSSRASPTSLGVTLNAMAYTTVNG